MHDIAHELFWLQIKVTSKIKCNFGMLFPCNGLAFLYLFIDFWHCLHFYLLNNFKNKRNCSGSENIKKKGKEDHETSFNLILGAEILPETSHTTTMHMYIRMIMHIRFYVLDNPFLQRKNTQIEVPILPFYLMYGEERKIFSVFL